MQCPAVSPARDGPEAKTSVIGDIGAAVIIIGVLFGVAFSGYVWGINAQHGGFRWPGVKRPVYEQSFSFDKLDDIDASVRDLEDELDTARRAQQYWKEKARELIGQPQSTVKIKGWTKPGTITIDGADDVVIEGCTFDMTSDGHAHAVEVK